ncbi:TetR/AcrR family transcriptional regulator [Streptomyces noursei]|uniref:TetR family transcriptional regulator n=1 Tax=Streptomyces noursei TaxID=1971 RepID=A0A2N8PHH1_STRNR|nr:TetR/AcrR family transcriptional regulator [Streptomyces noursei]PNE40426.1 TetR family transcriptional regulator [Streptomyces noursei]
MPRQVDHEERRRRIAEAVCALADSSGLEGVTLRDVATRAGVSMGAVQRCFRTKQEMLVFALDHVGERVTERVTAQVNERAQPRTASGTGPTGSALEHVLGEVALVDEARRTEARVWLAFVAQAAVTPELATVLRDRYAGLHPLLVRLLRESRPTAPAPHGGGAPHADRDPHQAAHTLLALADGLTTHVLIGHLTPQAALELLNAQIDAFTQAGPMAAGPREVAP